MSKRIAIAFGLLTAACGGATQQVTATADAGPEDTGAGDAAPAPLCDPRALSGIQIATQNAQNPLDPLGYPPYALDGCTLVYIAKPAAPGTFGDLRMRDLAKGTDTQLAPASEEPRRPAIAGDIVAWEASVAGRSLVRVLTAGATTTINGTFDHAGEPRVTADAVVFTAWLGSDANADTDVYLYLPASKQLVPIATGPAQQRFADVSDTQVAVTDFSEDPDGYFKQDDSLGLADIVLFDRKTLAKTVRHLDGKQAFPMLSRGRVAYLDWFRIHPEPKFTIYALKVGEASSRTTLDANVKDDGTEIRTNTPYMRPTVRAGSLEWVDQSAGGGGLFRRPIDLSRAATNPLNGIDILGPVAGDSMTIIATSVQNGGAELRGVPR